MTDDLFSVGQAIDAADEALRTGRRTTTRVIATGFALLDTYLGGGLRSGELCLLGGPQGLGKTAFVLQVARQVADQGGAVIVMSYEHDSSTLLERLIAIEAAAAFGLDGVPVRRVREVLAGAGSRGAGLGQRLSNTAGGVEALAALRAYGDRLLVHRSSGALTGPGEIKATVAAAIERSGRSPLVIVDYLQKVPGAGGSDDERAGAVAAALKDLALELDLPVLAVASARMDAVAAGRRMRVNHLHGSAALAYEPDVILILNEKIDVVARHHLVYDLRAVDRFRDYLVVSLEKNRSGLSRIDLQLRKRLEQSCFERDLEVVPEELADERLTGEAR